MKLTLCYAPQTCATVPFITLTEAGADFDVMNLNSRTGQLRSAEFLQLNPKHKVPVLIIDGEALTENLALQVWIAAAWADGVLKDAESAGMRAVIDAAKLSDEEKAIARAWLGRPISLEDINVSQIPTSERANVFSAALGVVAMDDEVVADEHHFLERLQIALQLDDATAASLRQRVGV